MLSIINTPRNYWDMISLIHSSSSHWNSSYSLPKVKNNNIQCQNWIGYGLYYPKGTLAGEIVILSFFFIYELIRKESGLLHPVLNLIMRIGTSGNKTENSTLTCTFIVLNIVSLGGFIFFLALQRYVYSFYLDISN
jgi:hypothetical protein